MTIKVAINGYGRIGRNMLRAHYEGGKKHDIQIVAINDLGKPETNAHLTKYDTAHGPFPGSVSVDGDSHGRQRRQDPRARDPQPGRAAVEGPRRRRRDGVHRLVHDQGKGRRAPRRRREEGHHLGARRQGRRRDDRLRRQPPGAEGERHGDQQRELHDQLPGAAGQGAARQDRRRARA